MRALALAIVLCLLASGCVEQLTPATKSAIAQVKNDAALASAKADAAQKAAEAAAKAKPTSHPIEWANLIIQQVRGPLILVGSIATLAFFVGIGLWVASFFAVALKAILSSVAYLVAPIAGCVSGGCWLTLAFLPWAPWIIGGCASLALVLFLVQLARAHWNIKELFGLHAANSAGIKAVKDGKPLPRLDVPVPPVVAPKAVITDIQAATGSQHAPIG